MYVDIVTIKFYILFYVFGLSDKGTFCVEPDSKLSYMFSSENTSDSVLHNDEKKIISIDMLYKK